MSSIGPMNGEPGATILIAEDQPEVQHAIQLLLKTQGHRVQLANSPDQALDAISATEFDLLLIDLNYHRDTTSGDEGLKLLNDLRARQYDRPVVAMTAWGSIDLAVEAMHRGACDFVQKPWDNDHLIRVVNKHVEAGREQRRIRRRQTMELQEAIAVQRRLMPRDLPRVPGIKIAGDYRPASHVGGDYFDVFNMGDKVGICIGDVIGHGVAAALMMSNLQAAVKVTAAEWIGPADLCARVNELVCRNGASDKFVSFFYSVLDPSTRTLKYCNCGHNAPILCHGDGRTERLENGGMLLGLRCDERYTEAEVQLEDGDRLLLFTDGLIEAGNSSGAEYGDDRLLELLRVNRAVSAQPLLERVIGDVRQHCTELEDDLTCVVLSIEASARADAA